MHIPVLPDKLGASATLAEQQSTLEISSKRASHLSPSERERRCTYKCTGRKKERDELCPPPFEALLLYTDRCICITLLSAGSARDGGRRIDYFPDAPRRMCIRRRIIYPATCVRVRGVDAARLGLFFSFLFCLFFGREKEGSGRKERECGGCAFDCWW